MKILILVVINIIIVSPLIAQDIWEESDTKENDTNAKVLRYIAKQRALEGGMSAKERAELKSNQGGECGSTNIGNVSGGSKKVENIVIIKGDVINANNKCK